MSDIQLNKLAKPSIFLENITQNKDEKMLFYCSLYSLFVRMRKSSASFSCEVVCWNLSDVVLCCQVANQLALEHQQYIIL
jgi:hypothetical protein